MLIRRICVQSWRHDFPSSSYCHSQSKNHAFAKNWKKSQCGCWLQDIESSARVMQELSTVQLSLLCKLCRWRCQEQTHLTGVGSRYARVDECTSGAMSWGVAQSLWRKTTPALAWPQRLHAQCMSLVARGYTTTRGTLRQTEGRCNMRWVEMDRACVLACLWLSWCINR